MDVFRVRVRELLQELSGSSQIVEKHIERVIFLSDSDKSDQKKSNNSDMEQIDDLTFLLSDREIEVIDELYPMEIETFTKHITKIKCGHAYGARFNPSDHFVNVCHWIKKSIGCCRNQRIRNDDSIDIGDVQDLESHLSCCILKHDEERDRLKLTKKDDTDQTVPNVHSDVHDVPEENGGQDPSVSPVLPEVMDDKDKDVLSGDSTEKPES